MLPRLKPLFCRLDVTKMCSLCIENVLMVGATVQYTELFELPFNLNRK